MTTQTPKKGLFSRLKDAPPQTAREVDGEIQTVQAEIADFQRQREAIKAQLADNWGLDSQTIEDEFQRLNLRLEAAQTVVTRLRQERIEARKREIVAGAVENIHKRITLNAQDKELYATIQRLEAELKTAEQTRHEVSQQLSTLGSFEHQQVNEMNQLGVTSEQAQRMFTEAYQAGNRHNEK